MRVLVISTDFPPLSGGISRLTAHVVAHLAARGHEVRVLAPRIGDEVDAAPWHVVRTAGYRWGWLRIVPMFWALLAEPRPQLVIAMNMGYGGLMSWLLRLLGRGAPYAVCAYGLEFSRYAGRPLMRALYGRVLAGAARVFAISRPIRERLLAFAPLDGRRVEVLWPGVDPARFDGCDGRQLRQRLGLRDRPMLFTLSRLVPRKGHDVVIRALAQIAEAVDEVAYVVAGDGPCRADLRALAEQCGVATRVHWLGEIDEAEVVAAYAACDLFVLPCREIAAAGDIEGFGIVFVEAGAAGRAVIGGDSGGVRDAVIDGVTGLVVDPTSVRAVADAAIRLLRDRPLAEAMGRAGRRRAVEEFTWDHVLAPLAAFCETHSDG